MENNYKEYFESYTWKALKKMKLEEQPNCECCWVPATTVHHLSYERIWSEREDDIVSVCERCYYECNFVNWYQIKNDEETLRRRFEEVRREFWGDDLVVDDEWDEYRVDNYSEVYKNNIPLETMFHGFFNDWKNIYFLERIEHNDDYWYNDYWYDDYEIERRKEEWWDGPENDWLYHPAFDW